MIDYLVFGFTALGAVIATYTVTSIMRGEQIKLSEEYVDSMARYMLDTDERMNQFAKDIHAIENQQYPMIGEKLELTNDALFAFKHDSNADIDKLEKAVKDLNLMAETNSGQILTNAKLLNTAISELKTSQANHKLEIENIVVQAIEQLKQMIEDQQEPDIAAPVPVFVNDDDPPPWAGEANEPETIDNFDGDFMNDAFEEDEDEEFEEETEQPEYGFVNV